MKNILLLCSCFVLIACGGSKKLMTMTVEKLEGEWVLQSISTLETAKPEHIKQVNIAFNTREKRLSGSSGCNRINGALKTLEEGKFTVAQVMSTRMACRESERMDIERVVLGFLSPEANIVYGTNEDGALILENEKGEQLTLIKGK